VHPGAHGFPLDERISAITLPGILEALRADT
jgi:hypothetical protein